jgi:hypothetical protein
MAKKKWIVTSYGSNDDESGRYFYVVDNRWGDGAPTTLHQSPSGVSVSRKKIFGNFRYTPKVLITASDALPPDESKSLAEVIAKALNAEWVKEELETS